MSCMFVVSTGTMIFMFIFSSYCMLVFMVMMFHISIPFYVM